MVWVNRKRVFNDARMIRRHVVGTVFMFSKEKKVELEHSLAGPIREVM